MTRAARRGPSGHRDRPAESAHTTQPTHRAQRHTGWCWRRVMRGAVAGALGAATTLSPALQLTTAHAAEQCGQRTSTVLLPETSYPLVAYGADQLSRLATGAGVTVAVVSSGVTAANPHFRMAAGDVVLPGTTVLTATDQSTAQYVDAQGHTDPLELGTAAAGLVAARRLDGSGVMGLAPGATILPIQAYGVLPSEEARLAPLVPTPARLASGIRYAVQHGARIILVPLSIPTGSADLEAAVTEATAAGSLVVAGAGERTATGATPDTARYPAAYPSVLAVSAVSQRGVPVASTVRGSFVGVAAPGEGLNTTFGAFGDCVVGEAPTSGYAAALTAATAALVAQRFPDAEPAMWKYRIESAAIRPVSDQHDPALGWGLLSPYDALTLTLDTARPGPTAPGSVREVLPVAVVAADPIAVAPDPLDDSRRLGLWLGGIALAGALALRMIRSLRAR